jgi:pimeloyl-ACP methyl ester carboxylesterase
VRIRELSPTILAGDARARVSCLAWGLAILLSAVGASSAQAASSSLYSGRAPRPGPDVLYAPLAAAPQLENAGPWKAPPILTSGAEAYRQGEFLYQGFLYDDHGAASTPDPTDPFNPASFLFSPKHGTITYPTEPVYANNAANLVELRVKPLTTATAFRVTLNTLNDPNRVAFTIALGESSTARPWPFNAGVESPAQLFLTVHGTTGVLTDATTGVAVAPAPTVSVDTMRRQFEVRVPHAAWNPGTSVVRTEAGVGLWSTTENQYLRPGPAATATTPGGCAGSCPAFFDMAFRTNEPVPRIYECCSNTIVEGGAQVKKDGSWWRERRQGDVLASGNVSEFNAEVDFAKLAGRVNDESAVPTTGNMDRIMASHSGFGQGVNYNSSCLTSQAPECTGVFVGQLQPYALYVPAKPVPPQGFGLVVSMHGLSANYNEFLGSHEASEMAEQGTGSIFASPESRGPDGSYKSYAETDVFEMWADIARHYRLNPEKADVTGYSMGGGGTYRLASRWPDLWARAFPIVGPPTSEETFASLRNIPVLAWYGQNDELVPVADSEQAFLSAKNMGLRYDMWVFAPAGHVTEGNNDEYTPAAQFFGDNTVDRNPYHVTYLVDPGQDTASDSPANHAYWISALTVRTAGSTGKIDALSHAAGLGDPPPLPEALSAATLEGGSHGPLPYTRRTLAWGPTPTQTAEDRIGITATNLATATIEPRRAGVNCKAKVEVTSDGPFDLTLAGCNRVIHAE